MRLLKKLLEAIAKAIADWIVRIIFRGVLAVGAGPRAAHWRDIGGVEELLLTQARERGWGEALEVFGAGSRETPPRPSK